MMTMNEATKELRASMADNVKRAREILELGASLLAPEDRVCFEERIVWATTQIALIDGGTLMAWKAGEGPT